MQIILLTKFVLLILLHGVTSETAIRGGSKANIKDNPFMINLLSCGGTLIHSRFILTAAHCLGTQFVNINGQRLRVANSHSYPGFYTNWDDYTHKDIAILELSEYLNASFPPLALPNENTPYENLPVVTLGWGKTDNQFRSPELKQMKSTTLNEEDCLKFIKNKYGKQGKNLILTRRVCMKQTAADGVCRGDSGGPLIANYGTKDAVLIGVTTLSGCNDALPAVYERVSGYLKWIHTTIEEAEKAWKSNALVPSTQRLPTVPLSMWHMTSTTNCMGTFLSPQFILTSARCLYDARFGGGLPRKTTAYVGSKDAEGLGGTEYSIEKHFVHPEYNYSTKRLPIYPPRNNVNSTYINEYDFVLYKLKKPVPASQIEIAEWDLQALGIPSDQMYQQPVISYGWDHTNYYYNLKTRTNNLYSPQECQQAMGKTFTSSAVCMKNEDIGCFQQSGSPLFTKFKGKNILIGLNSFGFSCGKTKPQQIFSKTENIINWIKKHVNSN